MGIYDNGPNVLLHMMETAPTPIDKVDSVCKDAIIKFSNFPDPLAETEFMEGVKQAFGAIDKKFHFKGNEYSINATALNAHERYPKLDKTWRAGHTK